MTKKQKKELREEFRSLKTSLVQKKGDLQKDKQDIALQKANKMAAKEERMTVSLYWVVWWIVEELSRGPG